MIDMRTGCQIAKEIVASGQEEKFHFEEAYYVTDTVDFNPLRMINCIWVNHSFDFVGSVQEAWALKRARIDSPDITMKEFHENMARGKRVRTSRR